MKRISIITALLLIASFSIGFAEESKKSDISGSSFLYMDAIHVNGKDTTQYWSKSSAKYRGVANLGLEVSYGPTGNYSLVRPYVGPVFGPVTLIGGYSVDSDQKEFAFGGVKYTDRFGKLGVFVDSRNYSPLNKNGRLFWDTLYEVTYRVGITRLGINVVYDKYWDGDKRDYLLAGPIVYADISKNVQVFVRFAPDFLMTPQGTTEGTRTRAGLMFVF